MARTRLELVAEVFDPASTAFLRRQVRTSPHLALDLGCAAGTTTRLVAAVTGASTVIGLDTSDTFLRAARTNAGDRMYFVQHDATTRLPTRPPDLIYARLLLAHLPDPAVVAARWADQLAPDGLLLLDEVEFIHTTNPVLAFYEEVVVGLVGARGAPMYAGPLVDNLTSGRWKKKSDDIVGHAVSTADAARMYSMNLQTWRDDPFVTATYRPEQIDDLAASLTELTRSKATDEIEWGLRQLTYCAET